MATSTFDLTDSHIIQSGRFEYGYVSSQRAIIFWGNTSTISFTATGTDCSVLWAVTATGTNYLQVSVDGGAFSNLTVPGSINTYTSTTLFTGLSDADHTVVIKHNAGTVTNSYFQLTAGLSVTGAAPALKSPSTSVFGAVYRIWNRPDYFIPEGVINEDNSVGHNRLNFLTPDAGIRFRANPTSIQVFSALNGVGWRVAQDGIAVGSKVADSGAGGVTYGWTTLVTGLDGNYHNYHITSPTASIGRAVAVNLIGGDIDAATKLPQRAAALWVGDSITAGTGTADSMLAFPWLLSQALGYQSINAGVSGMLCLATGTTGFSAENQSPDFYGPGGCFRNTVQLVVVNIGHNDSIDANLGASNSEFRASYVRLLGKLKLAYPNAAIFAVSPIPTTIYNSTVKGNLNADVSAAATTVGGVTYIDGSAVTGFVVGTDTSDGTHPNSGGYVKIQSYLQPSLPAATILSGGAAGIKQLTFSGGF